MTPRVKIRCDHGDGDRRHIATLHELPDRSLVLIYEHDPRGSVNFESPIPEPSQRRDDFFIPLTCDRGHKHLIPLRRLKSPLRRARKNATTVEINLSTTLV